MYMNNKEGREEFEVMLKFLHDTWSSISLCRYHIIMVDSDRLKMHMQNPRDTTKKVKQRGIDSNTKEEI